MRQTLIRMAILMGIVVAVSGADGLMRGFSMGDLAATSNTLPVRRTPSVVSPGQSDPARAVPQTEEDPSDGLGMTSAELLEALMSGEAIAIDARVVEDYTRGHLPGAISLPYQAFSGGRTPEVITILDPMMTYVVYCEGGDCHSSHLVASMMKQFGFESVAVFERGFPAWVEAGFEVEEGEPYL